MACSVLLFVRIFQAAFALTVLAGTADIAYKFSQARQFNDKYDTLDSPIPQLIDDFVLSTPHRVYLGMFVAIWTLLVTFYIIIFTHFRNGKFAPHAAIIGLEIPTIMFWFCAFIALALFAAEIEPICLASDEVPIIKRVIESCLIMKTATAFAVLSWVLWFITCITVSVQACRSRKKKSKAQPAVNGLGIDPRVEWGLVPGDGSKSKPRVTVSTVEMVPFGRDNPPDYAPLPPPK